MPHVHEGRIYFICGPHEHTPTTITYKKELLPDGGGVQLAELPKRKTKTREVVRDLALQIKVGDHTIYIYGSRDRFPRWEIKKKSQSSFLLLRLPYSTF